MQKIKRSSPSPKGKAKSATWSLLQNKTFQLLVLLIPTQLALHFWPDWALVNGIRVDYLAPAIYLTDLITFALIFFWLIKKPKISGACPSGINFKLLLGLLIFAILNIYFASVWQVAFYRWIKIFEIILLSLFLVQKKREVSDLIPTPLAISIVYVSAIAILQFLLGHTLGGLFYFLGERNFNIGTPGIALVNLFGQNFLRPYGTFSHPNALAGFLGVAIIFLLFSKKNKLTNFAILIGGVTFILTFSQNALLSLLVVFFIYKFKKVKLNKIFLLVLILFSLTLPLISKNLINFNLPENLSRRVELNIAAGYIFSKNPILGIGAGNFTIELSKIIYQYNLSWWLQPVHNIFLLIASEEGTLGLIIFFLMLSKIIKADDSRQKLILIFILLTGLSDHYWLTQQQNLLVLGIFAI